MKRHSLVVSVMILFAFLVSCTNQGSVKAGSATAESLLQLIPKDARGVIMVDIHKSLTTDMGQKTLADPKAKAKLDEFVQKSGIDPAKDLYFLAVAITGTGAAGAPEGVAILNLKYNKEALLAKLKAEAKGLQEETYNGVTIYKNLDGEEARGGSPEGAFLDESNIALGTDAGIKAVIDLRQKKGESIVKSAEMAPILKNVNKSAICWIAFAVPPELAKKAAENPMLKAVEGVTGLTVAFDTMNKDFTADFRTMGGTKEQNTNLANMLTGLKAMGATYASKEPAVGQVLNAIEITSGDNFVKLYARVPAEVMEQLQKKAEEMGTTMMQKKAGQAAEEKKEEGAEIKK